MRHGLTFAGLKPPPEYNCWTAAKQRCYNPNSAKYPSYGGRGIRMCDRWRHDYLAFIADMGPRPTDQHSIDRIDNDGDYEPSNCRWATRSEQLKNRRRWHWRRSSRPSQVLSA